jgi:hypothetical protein
MRFKTRVNVLREDPSSPSIKRLQREVKNSDIVKRLLSHQTTDGTISPPDNVYGKWQGAHWILGSLADIGYPSGDPATKSICEQVQTAWLSPHYFKEFEANTRHDA